MNLKVAHLVFVQFGMFVGIVICLAFFRFELATPRTAAEMRKPATERARAVERMSEPEDERADMADNREKLEPAEPLTDQPAYPLPNEYSPEAVEKSMAVLTKLYYEQIAPRRNASSSPVNSSVAAVAPSYTEVAEEPEVLQMDDPAPQTVAYVQPTQFVVFPQPAVVVFSQPRRFVGRCRPAPHPGAFASNSHRRWDNGGTHLNGLPESRPARPLGPQPRRTTGVPTCPSTQGLASRGNR
jgi:hypothetical protein